MSLNIGGIFISLFTSLRNGVRRGVQLEIDGGKLLVWAFATGNTEAISAVVAIEEEQIKEAKATTGDVPDEIIGAILSGGLDPFAGSRKMLQDAEAKWGAACAAWWKTKK